MTQNSPADLLVLHAVRILGFADTAAISRRFGLDSTDVKELLLDAEAYGWATYTAYAGTAGWSLTERGRAENERQLAAELARTGRAEEVHDVYGDFLPLNAILLQACTDWQLKPAHGDRLVPNDHADRAWDASVLQALAEMDQALPPLVDRLADLLTRFRGYETRFTTALARAGAGDSAWVDRTDVDSCHRVWFELHEDLIATLGIRRT